MNSNDRVNLIKRINTLKGLTDKERSAMLYLLRENKTYGLVWEDKPEAVEERLRNELPVLTEVKERAIVSDAPDAPDHILIEGDNLEALTTLAYTHAGRIDVIYIDPPYNTGNKDFVYNDSFVDREDTYRHSKWLSFMSRRLRIAKQLLSDKGVIFISIDDNEQAQLKLLCDEIFNSDNFKGLLTICSNPRGSMSEGEIAKTHDYLLIYAKNKSVNAILGHPLTEKMSSEYKYYDKNGKYRLLGLRMRGGFWRQADRPNLYFPIYVNPDNLEISLHKSNDFPIEIYPVQPSTGINGTWRWSKEKITSDKHLLTPIKVKRGDKEIWDIAQKDYYSRENGIRRTKIKSVWDEKELNNQTGTIEVKEIFCDDKVFSYPKPIYLISNILKMFDKNIQYILDFFAGSGTTLHATMQLNAEDGGHRQCILVTNNENGICENVTYERNKRVIQGYTTPKGEQVAGLTGNTLRYYKTDFVSRARSVQNMRRLVNLSTDMLCIKEDLYTEQPTFCGERTYKNIFRYFDNGQKQMLVIYREEAIDRLVELIYGMDVTDKIKIYVFSPSEDPWEDSFEDVSDKVELCALPAAIYNTYRRILPKKKGAVATPEEDEAATHKAENPVNGMLNFSDEGDEA